MADNQNDRIPENLYGKRAVDRNGRSAENQDSKMAEDRRGRCAGETLRCCNHHNYCTCYRSKCHHHSLNTVDH